MIARSATLSAALRHPHQVADQLGFDLCRACIEFVRVVPFYVSSAYADACAIFRAASRSRRGSRRFGGPSASGHEPRSTAFVGVQASTRSLTSVFIQQKNPSNVGRAALNGRGPLQRQNRPPLVPAPVMERLTRALQVVDIPEQLLIAVMWNDVIHNGRVRRIANADAHHARGSAGICITCQYLQPELLPPRCFVPPLPWLQPRAYRRGTVVHRAQPGGQGADRRLEVAEPGHCRHSSGSIRCSGQDRCVITAKRHAVDLFLGWEAVH